MKRNFLWKAFSYLCIVTLLACGFPAVGTASAEDKPLTILSGNVFSASDPNYGGLNAQDTGATYSLSISEEKEWETQDGGSWLTDGTISYQNNIVTSNWYMSQELSVTAVFDLKNSYNISQVDVWSVYGGNNDAKMESFTVEVSQDGIDYENVGVFNNTYEPSVENLYYDGIEWKGKITTPQPVYGSLESAKSARYVRVTMAKSAPCSQLRLSEIIILGEGNEEPPVDVPMSILSGNIFSGDDPNYGEIESVVTGATYSLSLTEGKNWESGAEDEGNWLTDGFISYGNKAVKTDWYGYQDLTVTAVFDLKDSYKIHQVDVWSVYAGKGQEAQEAKMESFTVEVSQDGNDYEPVGTFTNTYEASADNLYYDGEDLEGKITTPQPVYGKLNTAQEAQYVRITMLKSNPYAQLRLNEIVILGEGKEIDPPPEVEPGPMSILSGNIFSGSDEYYGETATVNTGATYSLSITEGKDWEAQDDGSRLTDGIISYQNQTVTSNWYAGQDLSITAVFDLKSNYNISQVDVWSVSGGGDARMESFTVEVSQDGDYYENVGTFTNTFEDRDDDGSAVLYYDGMEWEGKVTTPQPVYGTLESAKSARYVRITMAKTTACPQLRLSEIIILGSVSASEKLAALLEQAEEITEEALYTTESWAAFTVAVENAKSALESGDTDQLNSAYDQLNAAMTGLKLAFEEKIISTNASTADLQALYPGMSYTKGQAATYTWEVGSDTGFITNDPNSNMLLNGIFREGADGLYSGYDTSGEGTITIDLKDEYYVSQVDVWVQNKADIGDMKSYDVAASMDGQIFEPVCSVEKGSDATDGVMVCTSATFRPVTAQYLRITFHKADGSHNYVLGDVVLKGFQNRVDKTSLYRAIASVKNLDGEIYTTETWNAVIKARDDGAAVYASPDATQDDVIAAVAAIEQAIANLKSDRELKIITDNSFGSGTAGDDADYYDWNGDNMEKTGVTYEYDMNEAEADKSLPENDVSLTKLIGGFIDSHEGGYTTFSTWDATLPGVVTFDFQQDCYIGQVDVWSTVLITTEGEKQLLGDVEVQLSRDGQNFYTVATARNPYKDEYDQLAAEAEAAGTKFETTVNTEIEFPTQKARYMRLKMWRYDDGVKTANKYVLCEVVAHGFIAPPRPNVEFDISEIYYMDQDGADIYVSTLPYVESMTVTGKVFNNTANDKDVTVFSVIYTPQNEMVGFTSVDLTTKAGMDNDFIMKFDTVPSGMTTQYQVKTFVWDSVETALPLTSYKTLGVLE